MQYPVLSPRIRPLVCCGLLFAALALCGCNARNGTNHSRAFAVAVEAYETTISQVRTTSPQFQDGNYYIAYGPAPNEKTAAVVEFDAADSSNTNKSLAASVSLSKGWAITVRNMYYRPVRTIRVASGVNSTFVTVQSIVAAEVPPAADIINRRAAVLRPQSGLPSARADDEEVLFWTTNINDVHVDYVFVLAAPGAIRFDARNKDNRAVKQLTISAGQWAKYDRNHHAWSGAYEFPTDYKDDSNPEFKYFRDLLCHIYTETKHSYFKNADRKCE